MTVGQSFNYTSPGTLSGGDLEDYNYLKILVDRALQIQPSFNNTIKFIINDNPNQIAGGPMDLPSGFYTYKKDTDLITFEIAY